MKLVQVNLFLADLSSLKLVWCGSCGAATVVAKQRPQPSAKAVQYVVLLCSAVSFARLFGGLCQIDPSVRIVYYVSKYT